jgi:PKD repeat protein
VHTYNTPGIFTVSLNVTNASGSDFETKTDYISVEPSYALSDILDNPAQSFTTSGDAPWFGQSDEFYYGGSAAGSGPIGDGQQSVLQTMVTGPAHISFYWKVSSEEDWDFLTFSIDGEEQASITGESESWMQEQYIVGSGDHTLTWTYEKDPECCIDGQDSGWLDKVDIEHKSLLADFTAEPLSGTVPLTVIFNDLSFATDITTWNWSFGDDTWFNTTDIMLRNTTHQYSSIGTYNVGLSIANESGNDTTTKLN